MKKIMVIMLGVAMAATAAAQDTAEVTLGTDLVSSYIWRGQELGGVSLQPALGVSRAGLSLSAWGSVGLSDPSDAKELDLTLAYSVGGLNVGVTDYWFSVGNYFDYAAHTTTHVWEANVGYDFGPLSAQWYTNIAGDDGINEDGDRAYSSYLELAAPFTLGELDWTASVGAVPFATSFYGTDGFAVTHIGLRATKQLSTSESFSLPIYAGLSANPCSERMYFYVGISLGL